MNIEYYENIIRKLIHNNCIDDYDNQGNYISYIFYGPYDFCIEDWSKEEMISQILIKGCVKDEHN